MSAPLPTSSVPMRLAVGRGPGAADGRHAQHLRHGRHVGLDHAGHAMGAQHQLHLLQHVAVVVDAGLVEADRGVDALLLEVVQRRHAGAQAEIGGAVVADAAAGGGQAVDVLLVQPHAVAERQAVGPPCRSGRCIPAPCSRRAAWRIPSGRRSRPGACASARRTCAEASRQRASAPCRSTSAGWPARAGSSPGACCGAAHGTILNMSMASSRLILKRSNQRCIGPCSSFGRLATNSSSAW